MGFYDGKKVLVVGGSAGIGRAIAEKLAREGASVGIAARGQARIDETVAALRKLGTKSGQAFTGVSFDVTDPVAIRAAAPKVLAALGGLDVLICNSGHAVVGATEQLPDEAFTELLQTNYLGHVHVVRAFLPHFTKQKSGHICLMSSMLGFFSAWGYGAYSASKYAIAGFAECLRQEMKRVGVGVTIYYPPTTRTPGLDAENKGKPSVVWQLESDNSFTKVYDAEPVAADVLKAIEKGRFEAFMGWDSWLVFNMMRHFPRITRWLNDQELDKAFKKVEAKGWEPNRPGPT